MAKKQDSWLTAGEVEAQFGFSRQALYHMRKQGSVRTRKDGRIYLYSAASLEAYFLGRDERKAKVKRP